MGWTTFNYLVRSSQNTHSIFNTHEQANVAQASNSRRLSETQTYRRTCGQNAQFFNVKERGIYIYNNYCALKGKITVVVVPTVRFNRRNFTHGFSCVLRMNVMTNNINRLVLLMEKQCVCCDVGKELLYAFCVKTELTFWTHVLIRFQSPISKIQRHSKDGKQ